MPDRILRLGKADTDGYRLEHFGLFHQEGMVRMAGNPQKPVAFLESGKHFKCAASYGACRTKNQNVFHLGRSMACGQAENHLEKP